MSFGMEYGGFGGGFDPMGFNQYGGGGFMPETTVTSPEAKSVDKKSVIPVTVKQFLEAGIDGNANIAIDGKEINTLKLIGYVSAISEHSTNISYTINDGTGAIDCKLWTSKDGGAAHNRIRQNMYVRIFGNPREYDSKREVIIYDICPVEDFNEVTHHILDVVLTHMQNTKGPLHEQSTMAAGAQRGSTPMKSGYNQNQFSNVAAGSMSLNQNRSGNAENDIDSNVQEAFRQSSINDGYNDRGLSVHEVHSYVKSRGLNASLKQVADHISYLKEEGILYETVDNCYQLTFKQ